MLTGDSAACVYRPIRFPRNVAAAPYRPRPQQKPGGPRAVAQALEPRRLLSAAYAVTDLSVLSPRGDFLGTAINDAGQVAGYSSVPDNALHAFLYDGTMHDLGSLLSSGPGDASRAFAINKNGDIAGDSNGPNGGHAMLYKNGVMQDLGALDPTGYNYSTALGVNAADQVVGYSGANGHPQSHAFLYSNGTIQDLGTPFGGTVSQATAINDSGQIAGYSQAPDRTHGFLYSNSSFQDIGQLADAPGDVQALAINNSGQIAGIAGGHAFFYGAGAMTDLGALSGFTLGQANAINAGGQVVGTCYGGLSYGRAFLYSQGSLLELNNLIPPIPGWTLTDARAINASGQIVCDGVNTGAAGTPITHSFLLTPSLLTVGSPAYDWQHLPQTLSFTFSADVSATLSRTTLNVRNLTTGKAIVPDALKYDAATNTAAFQFASALPDGAYRATLSAAAFSDSSGRHLAADFSYSFFSLAGDVNHDAQVDFKDLVILAANYGHSGASFAQGDLNYDGTVNFKDLVILAANYGHVILQPAALSPAHRPARHNATLRR